jgi:hypothetical protein
MGVGINEVGVRTKVDRPNRDAYQLLVSALRELAVPTEILRLAAIHLTEVTFDRIEDRGSEYARTDHDINKPRMLHEMAHAADRSQPDQEGDPRLYVVDPVFVRVPFRADRA